MATNTLHSVKSDIGRKRTHNEDCFAMDPAHGLHVNCDGMGGGNAGEIASRMAIEAILTHVKAAASTSDPELVGPVDPNLSATTNQLASAIRAANEAVHKASWQHAEYAGMGTTVVAIRIVKQYVSIAHVRDCR